MRRTGTMIAALVACCACGFAAAAQAPNAAPADANTATDRELRPEAWTGSLAEGVTRVRELAEAGEVEPARALADRLLAPRGVARARLAWREDGGAFVRALLDATRSWTEPLGWNGRPPADRARVRIERALISLAPEQRATAEDDLGRALALAPAGPLREAAAYDLALLPLLTGEEWRARIPELGGAPPQGAAPAPGGIPTSGADAEEDAPDPLEEARKAYLAARERLVQRLRIDWRDADTRANVELVQRRLRELDEIERQREEQEQQEQQQQQDQQQDSEDGEDGEQQEQQSEEQQDSQEQEQPDESPSDEETEEGEQDSQEQEESEQEQQQQEQDGEEEPREPQEGEPQEVHLSREELQRLLNRLAEHEREAEALRERRRQRGSRGVDQDW